MTKVLVIEDDKQIAFAMKRKLDSAGYQVDVANNGKEGMALYNQQPFDIVITDLIMPEQDGIETIQYLKREYPEQPIIAVSGGGLIDAKNYLDMAAKLGVDYHLEKPFKLNDLLLMVELIEKEME